MDKEVLIVEMPELNDETVIHLRDFLQAVMQAFESHYFCQLRRLYQSSSPDNESDYPF